MPGIQRTMKKNLLMTGIFAAGFLALAAPVTAEPEPASSGAENVVRRLTPEQYQQIVADVFGPTIKVNGRFEPIPRVGGLLAVGAGKVSVSATGVQGYDSMARDIADQVVSPENRATLLACEPAAANKPDDKCSREILSTVGKLLFRRPLAEGELQALVADAGAATTALKDYYSGLSLTLATLLVSPEFLFRADVTEPGPDGTKRLTAYSKASRLSFFIWNSAPDGALLQAAANSDLDTEKGLARQVDRMLASPRLEAGVRAFFIDMLGLERFVSLTKDALLYPKFYADVPTDAEEQTLRTIVDHLIARRGDYRDLFTTRHTFLTPILGAVYRIPVPESAPNTDPSRWVAHDYPADDPRIGILTQISFVSLHSHPGRSSPTLRGKALREIFLCQRVPDPPGNVDFTAVENATNPMFKTARERLNAHATEAMCTGCHKLVDPMGLVLENFDTSGAYRKTENNAAIDTSGALDGVKFTDAVGLAKAVHDHPSLPQCLVNRVYSYAAGRAAADGEADFVKYLGKGFAEDGYRVPALMRRIAVSEAFYSVAAPAKMAAAASLTK